VLRNGDEGATGNMSTVEDGTYRTRIVRCGTNQNQYGWSEGYSALGMAASGTGLTHREQMMLRRVCSQLVRSHHISSKRSLEMSRLQVTFQPPRRKVDTWQHYDTAIITRTGQPATDTDNEGATSASWEDEQAGLKIARQTIAVQQC